MFDFFNQVIGYIETAFNFLLNLIESLLQAIGFLVSSIPFVMAIVPYMPAIIGSCIVMALSVAVIKFIIGR